MTDDMADLPHDLRDRLKAELQRGERLIYASRAGIHIGWGSCAVALFYLGFAGFWCAISFAFGFFAWAGALGFAPPTMKSGGPWMLWAFALFSLPFIGIGLGLLAAPVYALAKQRRAVHAITNQRLLTVYAKPIAETTSHASSGLTFVRRNDHRDGRGTLRIGYGTERDSDGDVRALEVTWTAIKDARRAEAIVLNFMRDGKS